MILVDRSERRHQAQRAVECPRTSRVSDDDVIERPLDPCTSPPDLPRRQTNAARGAAHWLGMACAESSA